MIDPSLKHLPKDEIHYPVVSTKLEFLFQKRLLVNSSEMICMVLCAFLSAATDHVRDKARHHRIRVEIKSRYINASIFPDTTLTISIHCKQTSGTMAEVMMNSIRPRLGDALLAVWLYIFQLSRP